MIMRKDVLKYGLISFSLLIFTQCNNRMPSQEGFSKSLDI